jgi:hypothetical protein
MKIKDIEPTKLYSGDVYRMFLLLRKLKSWMR